MRLDLREKESNCEGLELFQTMKHPRTSKDLQRCVGYWLNYRDTMLLNPRLPCWSGRQQGEVVFKPALNNRLSFSFSHLHP